MIWLLPGGTNLPIAADVMNILRRALPHNLFKNLVMMQVDERYGHVGHNDSNWQKLIETGFDFEGVKTYPVLKGLSPEKTVEEYSKIVKEQFGKALTIIGQFGIGVDGHIAGIMPYSRAVISEDTVFYYNADPILRITLTPPWLLKIQKAFVFAFGETKKEAIRNLRDKKLSLEVEPSQILKKIPEVYFYSDQL